VRGLRITNPDQSDYCGLIQLCDSPPSASTPATTLLLATAGIGGTDFSTLGSSCYTYGIMSLVDKRDIPQKGDIVRFQLSVMKGGRQRTLRVLPVRKLVHARLDAIKGQVRGSDSSFYFNCLCLFTLKVYLL